MSTAKRAIERELERLAIEHGEVEPSMSPEAKIDDLMQSVAWLERRLDKLVRQVNKMALAVDEVEPPADVTPDQISGFNPNIEQLGRQGR